MVLGAESLQCPVPLPCSPWDREKEKGRLGGQSPRRILGSAGPAHLLHGAGKPRGGHRHLHSPMPQTPVPGWVSGAVPPRGGSCTRVLRESGQSHPPWPGRVSLVCTFFLQHPPHFVLEKVFELSGHNPFFVRFTFRGAGCVRCGQAALAVPQVGGKCLQGWRFPGAFPD